MDTAKGRADGLAGKQAQVNSLGFRGSEPVPGKPSVVIVGDSSVFGDGVDDHQTMSAQLARALDGRADVQNAGVPGYTCWQSRIWVDRVRPQLSPDVLVVYNQHSDYRRAALTTASSPQPSSGGWPTRGLVDSSLTSR